MRPVPKAKAVALLGLLLGLTPGLAVAQAQASATSGPGDPTPQSQLRDLCPDRPGKGTPSCILDAGRLQLETGVADLTHDRSGGVSTQTDVFGDTELRYGLTRTLEVELAAPLYTREHEHDRHNGERTTAHGFGDLTLGFRQSLIGPDGDGPSFALQPFVTAPTATDGVGDGGWEGGLIAPAAFKLPGDVALALSPAVDLRRDADGHGTHAGFAGVVGLSHDLGPINAGIELWGDYDDDPSGHLSQATLDFTAAWIPKAAPDLQLDAGLNAGLTPDAPDLEVYVGVSRRF